MNPLRTYGLILIYLLFSTGINVFSHKCGEELARISLFISGGDCCCEAAKKNCCKQEVQIFKQDIAQHHSIASICFQPILALTYVSFAPPAFLLPPTEKNYLPPYIPNPPPPHYPLYLQHSVFII